MAKFNYNVNDYKPLDEWELIPDGCYRALVKNCTDKRTKNGDGQMLELEFKIMDAKFNGREIKAWIIYEHPRDMAQQIGRRKIASINAALDMPNNDDSDNWLGRPLGIVIKSVKDIYEGKERTNNSVDNFKHITEADGAYSEAEQPTTKTLQTVQPQQPTQQYAEQRGGAAPWEQQKAS